VITVELGSNKFIDCGAILALGATPVLALKLNPLRVTLRVPADDGGQVALIDDGKVVTGQGVTTVVDERSFSVFVADQLVLAALVRIEQVVHLKVDLRPLGLVIYDDIEGLHIGTNVFSGNVISEANVAIALG
jgi:hypothetical protein